MIKKCDSFLDFTALYQTKILKNSGFYNDFRTLYKTDTGKMLAPSWRNLELENEYFFRKESFGHIPEIPAGIYCYSNSLVKNESNL